MLVLGTMPGQASLRAREYYAHPRNGFWPIIGEVLGLDPTATYPQRMQGLTQRGIALWDVLQSCFRKGSLDADIDARTVIANDFSSFLEAHPHIHTVCFNGAMAQTLYRRHTSGRALTQLRLPSTSPAHAAMPLAKKVQAWQQLAMHCNAAQQMT